MAVCAINRLLTRDLTTCPFDRRLIRGMGGRGLGMIRAVVVICIAGLLGACASPVVKPHDAGGNRADGIVTMSSTGSIFAPTPPEWGAAEAEVARECRGWGYRGGHSFSGDRKKCLAYDRAGRCVRTQVRRFYQCAG